MDVTSPNKWLSEHYISQHYDAMGKTQKIPWPPFFARTIKLMTHTHDTPKSWTPSTTHNCQKGVNMITSLNCSAAKGVINPDLTWVI